MLAWLNAISYRGELWTQCTLLKLSLKKFVWKHFICVKIPSFGKKGFYCLKKMWIFHASLKNGYPFSFEKMSISFLKITLILGKGYFEYNYLISFWGRGFCFKKWVFHVWKSLEFLKILVWKSVISRDFMEKDFDRESLKKKGDLSCI